MQIILKIFDYFREHRILCFSSLLILIIVLVSLVCKLDFKEDITDFLPVDKDYQESMKVYQEIAAADKIVLMFSLADTAVVDQNKVTESVDRFGQLLDEKDSLNWINTYEPQVDISKITDIFDFVYSNLPYYLDKKDFDRIDSLWKDDSFIRQRLGWVKSQLNSPMSGLIEPMFTYDPLGFGEDIASMLREFQPEMKYKQYNGYIFTEDDKTCIVSIKSPFGGSETDNNGKLIGLLNDIKTEIAQNDVNVNIIGSPVIAVSNANQIKKDTILAVLISVTFILALLLFSFRNLYPLIQIALSTGFGFLFALGFISLFRDSLSLIVVGIASIIIGIAVNYPLHYVYHLKEHDNRNSLKDLIAPLLIGNITTVGAFLTLVPLEAVAIRDLGLFSAIMLIGTIIFVLIYLPHLKFGKEQVIKEEEIKTSSFFNKVTESIVSNKLSLVIIFALTLFFGYHSLFTEFDTNMNHINYMTQEQKDGMSMLSSMRGEANGTIVYVTSTGKTYDESSLGLEDLQQILENRIADGTISSIKNPTKLLPSITSQNKHLQLWNEFWGNHNYEEFKRISLEEGFTDEAFLDFEKSVKYPIENVEETSEEFNNYLAESVFNGFVGNNSFVAQLVVPNDKATEIEQEIVEASKNRQSSIHAFDLTSLNGRIANTLSADFNYIGLACATIVFLFLWISFGRIELSIIAFLPMAIGWIWILGLMQITGISFNIVNIILASFIFGQGDDYTIFITEGLVKDYKEGKGILFSYQKSIILSALIMLVGIGSLIIAKHPAMHSLAEVTIIGMFVVVVMAWIIPSIAFKLFLKYDKSFREYLDNKK